MAFGLAQVAFLAVALGVAIGVPLAVVPYVRGGSSDDLTRPFRLLNWGFWLTIPSFAVAMTVGNFFPATEQGLLLDLVSNLALVAFYAFGWLYWSSLAVLAHRRGQSAALWVIAGLVTLGLGFIATYVLMTMNVRAALKAKQA